MTTQVQYIHVTFNREQWELFLTALVGIEEALLALKKHE